MKAALLQLNSSDDPDENLSVVSDMFAEAVAAGAQFILTPEVSNCVSTSRAHQNEVLRHEEDDAMLAAIRAQTRDSGVWCLIGSLALKTHDADGRFANRSFLLSPQGTIAAWYDKIHMFDVQVSEKETYRESDGYRPGDKAVTATTPMGEIGMTICYDLRFPLLFRTLAQSGAGIITVPSAFSPVTGAAHWETLLRARAIETGSFVLAPAQTGTHRSSRGKPRQTYGHSMVVGPWGDILADAGDEPGVVYVDINADEIEMARARIPSLSHGNLFDGP